MSGDRKASNSLLVLSAGAVLAVLAMAWAALPMGAAIMVTCAAFLGMEFGIVGARWKDERDG